MTAFITNNKQLLSEADYDQIIRKPNPVSQNFARRRLFPFRKRSYYFLTVNVTIGNHAFIRDRCNVFPRLSYNKANNTFLKSRRKNGVEAQVEFTFKVMERGTKIVRNFGGSVW